MGVTLYAFVYGKLPFHDENIVVLYDKIRNAPLVFPPAPFVSDDLKDLISLMLEKDPAKRITLPDIKVSKRSREKRRKKWNMIVNVGN